MMTCQNCEYDFTLILTGITQDVLQDAREVNTINGVLEMEYLKKQDAKLTKEVQRSVGTFCESCP